MAATKDALVAKAEAERDGFQDALVLARVQVAKAQGYTERALTAGEALAARVTAAEERAGRAEARLRKSLGEVMYAICENALRGEGESAGAVCKRAIEDAAKEAGRG